MTAEKALTDEVVAPEQNCSLCKSSPSASSNLSPLPSLIALCHLTRCSRGESASLTRLQIVVMRRRTPIETQLRADLGFFSQRHFLLRPGGSPILRGRRSSTCPPTFFPPNPHLQPMGQRYRCRCWQWQDSPGEFGTPLYVVLLSGRPDIPFGTHGG